VKKDEKVSAVAVQEEEEDLGETGRLFVRNLSYAVKHEELVELFSKHGDIAEIHISLNTENHVPKGYAFVQFVEPAAAAKALTALDGAIFQGRLLHVLPAKSPPKSDKPGNSNNKTGANSGFKRAKEDQQKQNAENSYNWNSLFMGVSFTCFFLTNNRVTQ
jgi:multiple RNA-binding domain-containing protein 1